MTLAKAQMAENREVNKSSDATGRKKGGERIKVTPRMLLKKNETGI
jgi:hypothetical protein